MGEGGRLYCWELLLSTHNDDGDGGGGKGGGKCVPAHIMVIGMECGAIIATSGGDEC